MRIISRVSARNCVFAGAIRFDYSSTTVRGKAVFVNNSATENGGANALSFGETDKTENLCRNYARNVA